AGSPPRDWAYLAKGDNSEAVIISGPSDRQLERCFGYSADRPKSLEFGQVVGVRSWTCGRIGFRQVFGVLSSGGWAEGEMGVVDGRDRSDDENTMEAVQAEEDGDCTGGNPSRKLEAVGIRYEHMTSARR
ncbi:hypothetical protein THAOC_20981, partial [Thalassiosira oceanica]